jgi:hypothetical protein
VVRVLLVAVLFASGCTLFEDKPDKSCKVSSDCFQAQGETCNTNKGVCVSGPDAQMTPVASSPSEVTP